MATNTKDAHLEVTKYENPERRPHSRFQPFKRLFRKRKKKGAEFGFEEAGLKGSQSTGDVCDRTISDDEETDQDLRELNTLGSRSFSHDSIFNPEGASSGTAMSQENVSDRVRDLQRQIAQSIKFGPTSPSPRKSENPEDSSDEEGAPRGYVQVLAQVETEPDETEAVVQGKVTSRAHGTPVRTFRSRREAAAIGTIESINLDAVPSSITRLDNTAARHKLSVKPKNQRVSRKHRRFTQDQQGVCSFGVLQETADPQTHADPTGRSSEDIKQRKSWTYDELHHETPEKSKKPKLQDDVSLLEELLKKEGKKDVRIKTDQKWRIEQGQEQEPRKEREFRPCETEEQNPYKLREEVEKIRDEEEKIRSEEVEKSRKDEEVMKQCMDEEVRQQELEAELQLLAAEKVLREENEKERKRREEEERKKREGEELKRQEEEHKRQEEEESKRQEEEESKRQEERKRQEVEESKRQEEERKRQEEEESKRQEEERKRQEEEERKRQEEEESKRQEEEERKRQEEEEHKRQEVEERKRQEEEECKRQKEEERMRQEAEKQKILEFEEQRQQEEKEKEKEKRQRKEEKMMQEIDIQTQRGSEQAELEKQEIAADPEKTSSEASKKSEDTKSSLEESVDPLEWKRKAEELRWKEVEDRQRPFTFKVSSGEKQILFQRVNLTLVSPSSQQGGAVDSKETKTSPTRSVDSPTLPSSLYVPHTAILVTGAQLCGAAVDFDQIKDTACKSLLGLSEDKKTMGIPNKGSSKTSPDRKSIPGKTKSLNESSVDPSSAAMLAEWASIRSKIFGGAENGKFQEKGLRNQNRPTSEDLNQKPSSGSHSNLRKTMSAHAKFSITPARHKFPDTNRTSEVVNQEDRGNEQNRANKMVRSMHRTEGCVFAKDLPSFLVPSPPNGSPKARPQLEAISPVDSSHPSLEEGDQKGQHCEDQPGPFGIKLRRTNYSLRFRSEQPVEKRKKRYSAGDSFDGIPVPLSPINLDSDSSILLDKSDHSSLPTSPPCRTAGSSPADRQTENQTSKPPLHQKPSVAPKPANLTPPTSPMNKGAMGDTVALKATGGGFSMNQEKNEHRLVSTGQQQSIQHEEEEPREKRSFFPSISISWREKVDRKTEIIRRDKPTLQSRHSLDSGRAKENEAGPQRMDSGQAKENDEGPLWTDSGRAKEKETGPLWITLALQKQKGFREQQLSREERRHMREARLAEKQSQDNISGLTSPSGGNDNGDDSSTPKLQASVGEKPDLSLGPFERREHLRKANTLPSSVTVEIADSTSSPPAVVEPTKRFPSTDSAQVCTEPAWLALAKRKAKAWSDCPQIIK